MYQQFGTGVFAASPEVSIDATTWLAGTIAIFTALAGVYGQPSVHGHRPPEMGNYPPKIDKQNSDLLQVSSAKFDMDSPNLITPSTLVNDLLVVVDDC